MMTAPTREFLARRRVAVLSFALALTSLGLGGSALAAGSHSKLRLTMETHAQFFSTETHQARPIDPQVFVGDVSMPAGDGPQGIHHAAGFRPALLADPPPTELFNATGHALGFTLGDWLAAKGTVDIAPDGKTITVSCENLRAGGTYSLFENHFDQSPVGFTPLDGSGTRNSFVARPNGHATVTVRAPQPLTHANAVLLVYHSDAKAHGKSRGEIGANAHHQLIARVP